MKFLHSNHKNNTKRGNIISPHFCYYPFLKWILWFFLSLYLFISFPSLSRTTPILKQNSRTLIESDGQDSLNELKIYVYELPARFNADWLRNERCSKHLFASEVAIHRALLESEFRTFDPYEADFFFVPVYVSCNFSAINGFPAIGHARSLISSAVELISSELPFWNRSRGSDHVFVASHDFGACFHTLEDVAMADGIPEIMKRSIILQTFGVKYKHPCQEVENVVIPPYIPPHSLRDRKSVV